jgi:urease accessory protein
MASTLAERGMAMILNRLNSHFSKTAGLAAISSMAACLVASPASAHHAMGGGLPSTMWQGFVSGVAHPVIGIDHLAFIVAVGLASAFLPNKWLPPLAFVAATVVGCLLMIGGFALPIAEIVITASVVLLGGMVLAGRTLSLPVYAGLFALAGLFHGNAYGQSIVGAEATPLLSYLVGFAAIQFAIAAGVAWLVSRIRQTELPGAVAPRLAGAVAAGVGFALLVENVEAMMFPTL